MRRVPWTMIEWINRAGAAVPQQQRHHHIVFLDLIGSRKAPIFFGTPCQNIEKSELWDGPGETFRTRRVRNTASLPWSPEPRTLNLWASKGVWGRSPQIAGSAGNCAAYLL